MLKKKTNGGGGNYLSIIDGSLRRTVTEGTPGAVKRDYEASNGDKGVKYELEYSSVVGKIVGVAFRDGNFGKSIGIVLESPEGKFKVDIGVEQAYGEDIMKKLPAIDLSKEVELAPYNFTDDGGKKRRGVTILQDGNKLTNFFFDKETKTELHGFPKPDGDTKKYDKDDWKLHFMKVRKFLVNYITDNIASKFETMEDDDKWFESDFRGAEEPTADDVASL